MVWAVLMCCCRATDIFAKPEGPHRLHAGQLDVTADGGNSKHHHGGRSCCPAAVTTGMPAADRAGQTVCDAGWGRVGRSGRSTGYSMVIRWL